jgi:protoporphyrinogen oxidase
LEPTYKKLLLNRLTNGEKISLLNSRYTADDLGARSKFPRALHVALRKKAFKNSKTKNAYYAEELLYAQKGWKSLIKELISSCAQQSDQISTSCRTSIQRIERFMRNDLMTIEQQRRRSSIE